MTEPEKPFWKEYCETVSMADHIDSRSFTNPELSHEQSNVLVE